MKARQSRAHQRLTHFEARRDKRILLKIAVAGSELPKIRSALEMIIARITLGTQAAVNTVSPENDPDSVNLIISPQHSDDDEAYHAAVREHFTDLFGVLCDASLSDALDIAREEQARRIEQSN